MHSIDQMRRFARTATTHGVASMLSRFPMLAMVAVLAGCITVGPDYQSPEVTTPYDWTGWRAGMPELREAAGSDAAALARSGWSLYHDPLLERLQRRALQANASLQTAAFHYAQSLQSRRIEGAAGGLQAGVSAGISRQRLSESGASTRVAGAVGGSSGENIIDVLSQPYALRQAGVSASWEIDLWGRIRRTLEAADADTRAASALLDDARLSIVAQVASRYFELRGLERREQWLGQQIGDMKTALALQQARQQRGLVDATVVNRQQAELDALQAQWPVLRASRAASLNQLAVLLEQAPAAIEPLLSQARMQQDVALPDLSPGLPSQLVRQRPDIAAAEARLHAATARIGVATASLYPSITLGGSFGYESTRGDAFGDWGSHTWSVGPSLSLPIFDRGRRRATIELRDLQAQEAAVAFQHTVLEAWQDVDDALSRYGAERLRNAHLQAQLVESERAYALVEAQQRYGLVDTLALLQARARVLSARQDVTASDASVRQQMAVLISACGGGLPQPDAEGVSDVPAAVATER